MEVATKKAHHGENIRKIREFKGKSQDQLAETLGIEWTQQKISLLESKEKVDEPTMQKVAKALNVSVATLESLNDELVNNFFNTFNDHSVSNGPYFHCTINPIDRMMEMQEEMKKIYEALILEKTARIELLEKILKDKS